MNLFLWLEGTVSNGLWNAVIFLYHLLDMQFPMCLSPHRISVTFTGINKATDIHHMHADTVTQLQYNILKKLITIPYLSTLPEESSSGVHSSIRGKNNLLRRRTVSHWEEIKLSPLSSPKKKREKKIRLPLYHITDEECLVLFPRGGRGCGPVVTLASHCPSPLGCSSFVFLLAFWHLPPAGKIESAEFSKTKP